MTDTKIQIRKFYKRITLMKTLTWRLISIMISFIVAWWFTGDIQSGGWIAILGEPLKFITYWLHEKRWGKYTKKSIKEIKGKC